MEVSKKKIGKQTKYFWLDLKINELLKISQYERTQELQISLIII